MLLDCVLGNKTGREYRARGVDGSLEEFMLSSDSMLLYSHNKLLLFPGNQSLQLIILVVLGSPGVVLRLFFKMKSYT